MATWQHFIERLTEELGAENVEGGPKDKKVVATVDVPAREGSTKKRRQKVHFEYTDSANWVSATSFIAPVGSPTKVSEFLEYLGKDGGYPGAVIVDGKLGLRNHVSLSLLDGESTEDTDEQLMESAFVSAAAVGILADAFEEIGTKEDTQ
ncbi:hypothetical protein OZK63_35525 [Streptomyces sp. UMAF16]|nr:hypothetical protein [Streptomyces sp. UMAF16]